MLDTILRKSGPWLHQVDAQYADFTDVLLSLRAEAANHELTDLEIRLVHGGRVASEADLFREFSESLEFPEYFGRNLDALEECLLDLEWLSFQAMILAITNADQMLASLQPHFRTEVLKILQATAQEWNSDAEPDQQPSRSARPFWILFQSEPESAISLQEVFRQEELVIPVSSILPG